MNIDADEIQITKCQKILKRIAWNLQYRARKRNSKELLLSEEIVLSSCDEKEYSALYLEGIFQHIPSDKGKYIIRKIIIDGYTERELANELNMTQQGVHKCKKKYLALLRQRKGHFM
ncbi:sigma-70 family RNA polymerase sigma factor [Brevibacillus sp. VP]|nr:sigma-70 family RNA polymerase sigma factor [Brevibacillus sp. VP]